MALTKNLIDVLKRELKARGLTYLDVAKRLDLSEASVKRMFSTRDFMLSRLAFSGCEKEFHGRRDHDWWQRGRVNPSINPCN